MNTADKSDLKPCPFCGSSGVIALEYYDGFCIMCSNCEIQTSREFSKTLVIEKWNTRHEPIGNSDELPEWLEDAIVNQIDVYDTVLSIQLAEVHERDTRSQIEALYWVLSLKKPEEEP